MLTGPLPALVDHRKMASRQQVLEGSVPLSQLSRFSDMLAQVDGDVDLVLAFSKGNHDWTKVSGSATATVALICQNCMQSYQQSVDCEIDVNIVSREEDLRQLDEDADGFVCTEPQIAVVHLVEDELILATPMIPRHAGQCPDNDYRQEPENVPEVEEEKTTHRPFAGLAEAMKGLDKPEN